MIVYLVFYTLITILFLLHGNKNGVIKNGISFSIFTLVSLFSGLRGTTGLDTPQYLAYYQMASNFESATPLFLNLEPLFVISNLIIRFFFDSNFFFIFIYSLLQSFLLFLIFRKIKNKIFILIYILIFYLNFHFNTIRAGTAILFFLYFLVEDKKYLKFIAAIAAPCFHISILIFYPFYVLILAGTRIRITFALILIVIFYAFNENILNFLDKGGNYADYLQGYKFGISIAPILIAIYILLSILCIKNKTSELKSSAFILLTAYVFYFIYPAAYRFIIMAQVIYLYFLFQNLSTNNFQTKKFIVLWPFVGYLFLANLISIYNESSTLSAKINFTEIEFNSLNSTYIPYKLYWHDENAQHLR